MLALVSAQLPKWDGEFRQGRSVRGINARSAHSWEPYEVGLGVTLGQYGSLWSLDGLEPGS